MSGEFNLETQIFELAAGEERVFDCYADVVRVLDADTAPLARINNKPAMAMPQGIGYTAPPGEKITSVGLVNPSASPISVTMSFATGDIEDMRTVIGSTIRTRERLITRQLVDNPVQNDGRVRVYGGTAQEIIAADPLRKSLTIWLEEPPFSTDDGTEYTVTISPASTEDFGGGGPYALIGATIVNYGDVIHIEGGGAVYGKTGGAGGNRYLTVFETVHEVS